MVSNLFLISFDSNIIEDISLEVEESKDLQESLSKFLDLEVLSDPVKTPDHGLQTATRQCEIDKAPQVLSLHLKRFKYDPKSESMSKVENLILHSIF
jgi:hypothetical protein